METQFHWQDHILQLPGCCCLLHGEEGFLAKEKVFLFDNYWKNHTSFLRELASTTRQYKPTT
jgi:hypothetical protein